MTRPEQPTTIWAVVKQSALRRLGKPLLLAYLALLVFGLVVVGTCVAGMRLSLLDAGPHMVLSPR